MASQFSPPHKLYALIAIAIFSIISVTGVAQKQIPFNERFGAEASAIFPGAEHIWLKGNNMVPAFIQLRDGSETGEPNFFFLLKKLFHLPTSYSFQLLSNDKDELGWEHHRYQLNANGVPVTEGIFITHLLNGKVKKYNGSLFKNINIGTSASLTEASALQAALDNTNASLYKWELPEENALLKQETGNPQASYFPKGKLEIVQTANGFHLAWKFDIYAHEPMSRNDVFIDAQTGVLLKKNSRICNANAAGTAVTAYRGSRAIVADSYNGQYRLNETTRGLGIHTYNMLKGTNYGNATEFLDGDNVWNNANANLDQYAGDAHWGAEMTYDFYQSMGRNSIDNAGFALNLYVHYSTNYVNAFWDGTKMTFGDGDASSKPLTSLDITGHEISHGLDEKTANLDYQDESGALNESFSDIFGAAVEWYADSTLGNWLVGEDIGGAFRSMSNPNTYGDPDTYQGTNWYTGTADNGGVHTNSNVQNFWYYVLSTGKSGTNDIGNAYNVTGITRHKATQIAWRNMVFYLTNTSQYADSRFYSIQAANDLFGTCSPEVIATTNAWYAVGVGAQFVNGVDAQFIAGLTAGCQVPTVVTFTNTSTNASVFTWDFGDGTTSNAQAPSHSYNSFGTYTVRLVSDGGSCGIDSLIRTNYISISANNPCLVVLPTTGTYQTQTACTGIVYDNGGPTGNCSDNTNSSVTIAPTGATQVRLHFTQLDMENTYDFVYVYDGPSTASPQIGAYTGTTLPADITSTGSSITIRQSTDPAVNGAGFTIQWTCISPTIPPVANFIADATTTCNGKVNFTDLSTSGPTSWLWNFGDGGTSTLKNPAHTYFTNGSFTVSLLATNAFGNNTSTKTNYIVVSKPAAPTTSNASRCGNGTLSLSANSTDSIKWYANATDTTALATINPFVTPVLNTNTTYYAEDIVPGSTGHVGPLNDSIGTATNYSNSTDRYLIFNCLAACTLKTVKIYASGSGNRTIVLRDSLGNILQTLTTNLANGLNLVTLNFPLPIKNNLRLAINGTANLFRNSTGAVFPYTLAGLVSITGTNGTAGYYYYFYDWVVKTADCISLRKAVTAIINPAVSVTASHTNVLCNGNNTGTATVNAIGGTPTFSYNWSGGANTATANNLVAGTYNVTVTDNAGCSATASRTITQPTALSLSKTVSADTCNRNTGKVISTVSGGTSGYTYLWNNNSTASSINNLSAGTFALTVHDANNCSLTTSATVNAISSTLSLSANSTNVLCNGASTGSATAIATGGFANLVYSWSNNASTASINNLPIGTYNVTATDGGGCSATASRTITQPTALSLSKTVIGDTCNRNTGKVISTVSGGTSGYTYLWNNNATASSINNLSAGTFALTVHDANNCSLTTTATVNSISSTLSLSANSTNVLCNGGNTGSATAIATGGFANVVYSWSNNASTASISNLPIGTYNITATDGGGCSATASRTITQPSALSLSTSTTNASCAGNDGSVQTIASGGTANYTYLWNTGANSATLQNIAAGNYQVTLTDANGCIKTASATVSAPGGISINSSSVNVVCFGNASGSASVAVTAGAAPYTYSWNDGISSAPSINNLNGGTYSVTVVDANHCSAVANFTLTEPSAALQVNQQVVNAGVAGNDGTVSLSVSGGTPAYTYLWNTGASTSSLNNLTAGTFFVTVTDANGCTATVSASVAATSCAITLQSSTTNLRCYNDNSGAITVVANNSTAPLQFLWNTGDTLASLINLIAGTYSVTVTDAIGCSASSSFSITEPVYLSANLTVVNLNCFGGQNGTASIAILGGTQPYSYLWCNGDTTELTSSLAAGICGVTATDHNGCSVTAMVSISQPDSLQVSVSAVNTTIGQNNGSVSVDSASGGVPPYSYAWSGGATVGLAAGNYTLTLTDNAGCTTTASAVVDAVTGIETMAQESMIQVFPNPAHEQITISSTQPVTEIKLVDVLGKLVVHHPSLNVHRFELNLSSLAAGVYMLDIKQRDKHSVKRIVIE